MTTADEVSELVPGQGPKQCELSFQVLVPLNCVNLPSSHAKPCPTPCCAFATATRIPVIIHSPNTLLSPYHDDDAVTVRVSSVTLVGNGSDSGELGSSENDNKFRYPASTCKTKVINTTRAALTVSHSHPISDKIPHIPADGHHQPQEIHTSAPCFHA